MLALDLIGRLGTLSPTAANKVLETLLPSIIPLTGGLGVRVRDWTDLRAETTLPLKRRTRNHVGSVYFGAQMTLAEITMGLLLFRRYPPGPYGMLVREVGARFHRKAVGQVRAVCAPDGAVLAALDLARTAPDGKAEAWVGVDLYGPDGVRFSEARFLASLKRFGAVKRSAPVLTVTG